MTTTLTGRFVDIVDTCGAISNSSPTGNLDLGGVNGQHDCTSGRRLAGQHAGVALRLLRGQQAGRDGPRLAARQRLAAGQLTANVNINHTCNAFWSTATARSTSTGRAAAAATPARSPPSSTTSGATAWTTTTPAAPSATRARLRRHRGIYRLQASCVGHGFFWTVNKGCGMTADGTGFNTERGADRRHALRPRLLGRARRRLGQARPNTPDTALGFVCTLLHRPAPAPAAGRCTAPRRPSRQAAWDLVARDLPAPPVQHRQPDGVHHRQPALLPGQRQHRRLARLHLRRLRRTAAARPTATCSGWPPTTTTATSTTARRT